MIRVLIVDDYLVIRQALEFMFSVADDIQVIGHAANGHEAYEMCVHHQPDVVLMDVLMPEVDGITAAMKIRKQFPGVKIILLTLAAGNDLTDSAMQAGVNAFLQKNITHHEIIDTIYKVMEHGDKNQPR